MAILAKVSYQRTYNVRRALSMMVVFLSLFFSLDTSGHTIALRTSDLYPQSEQVHITKTSQTPQLSDVVAIHTDVVMVSMNFQVACEISKLHDRVTYLRIKDLQGFPPDISILLPHRSIPTSSDEHPDLV